MKQIMIVDDELLVRAGLRSIVDWEANGYSILNEATSGHEAMRMIDEEEPDILLTDLIMEDGDGLELIDWCVKLHPGISIIVLSNYTDYDKVRKAMKQGAKDYLFKLTTTGSEILQVLNSIEVSPNAPIHQLVERNANAIRQELFERFVKDEVTDFETWKQDFDFIRGQFSIDLPYVVLFLRLGNFIPLTGNHEGGNPTAISAFENAIQEHFCKHESAQFFQYARYQPGRYFVLLNIGNASGLSPFEEKRLNDLYDSFSIHCERVLGIHCDGVFDGPIASFNQLRSSAVSCLNTMAQYFFKPEKGLQRVQTIPKLDSSLSVNNDIARIIQEVDAGNYEKAVDCVESLVRRIEGYNGDVQKARECLNELYIRMWDSLKRKGFYLDEYADDNSLSLYEAVQTYDYLCSIRDSFFGALRYVASHRQFEKADIHPLVLQTIEYIRNHLTDDLRIPTICSSVHQGESSLTKLFKKETGMNMVKYINSVRIERACNLLSKTEARIQDVAHDVGIDNPNYFSILFKKVTGLAPNEYRARLQTEK